MLETQINREYVRTDNWSIAAKVCKDEYGGKWSDVKIPNVAAGGLLFLTEATYEVGETLCFDLLIDPMMPGIAGKIPMKAKGVVRGDRGIKEGLHAYSIEFTDISKSNRIRLDELVRMTTYRYKLDSESDIFDR